MCFISLSCQPKRHRCCQKNKIYMRFAIISRTFGPIKRESAPGGARVHRAEHRRFLSKRTGRTIETILVLKHHLIAAPSADLDTVASDGGGGRFHTYGRFHTFNRHALRRYTQFCEFDSHRLDSAVLLD